MKKSKAGLALVLAMGLFSAGWPAESAQAAAFTDIKGHWAESQIEAMAKRGVIHGYPDGSFHPDAPVAVDEFMVMAWYNVSEVRFGERSFADWWIQRMEERSRSEVITLSSGFHYDQMGTNYWAAPYVFQSNLFDMIPKNPLGENPWNSDYTKPISREYAAYMLHQLVVYAENFENQTLLDLLSPTVPDIKNIDFPMSKPAILTLMTRGIMTGDPDGKFDPQRTLTRAEALSILERMHDPSLRQLRLPDLTGYPHALIPVKDYEEMFLFNSESGLQNYKALRNAADKFPGFVKESELRFYFFATKQDLAFFEDWIQSGDGLRTPFKFVIEVNDQDQDLFSMLIQNDASVEDTALNQVLQNLFGENKQAAKDAIASSLEKNRNHETFDDRLQIGGKSVRLYPHPTDDGGSSTKLHLQIK